MSNCPRFGSQPCPIQRLTPRSQVLHPTKSKSDTASLCPRSSPGQLLAEKTLLMSSNLLYPIQQNSRRQISYTASDNRTPDQSGAFAANKAADMDEIRMSSIFLDIPWPNLAAKTTKTKREDPKGGFKKNPTGVRLGMINDVTLTVSNYYNKPSPPTSPSPYTALITDLA